MITNDWYTTLITDTGTLRYNKELNRIFEWDGPPIESVVGLEYKPHPTDETKSVVYANGENQVSFLGPSYASRLRDLPPTYIAGFVEVYEKLIENGFELTVPRHGMATCTVCIGEDLYFEAYMEKQ